MFYVMDELETKDEQISSRLREMQKIYFLEVEIIG